MDASLRELVAQGRIQMAATDSHNRAIMLGCP